MSARGRISRRALLLLAGAAVVSWLGWRSWSADPEVLVWDGHPPTRPYPFAGRPSFEFSASEPEVRRALSEARARSIERGDGPLAAAGWRGFRLERSQSDALFPPQEALLVLPLGLRVDEPGRLTVELATNRAPERPFFGVSCHMTGRELLLAIGVRTPTVETPGDSGAYRVIAFDQDVAHVLADEQLEPADALPPALPDEWEPGWSFSEGWRAGIAFAIDEPVRRFAFSWNGIGSGDLALLRHPDRRGISNAVRESEAVPLSTVLLEEWPRPVWFLSLRYLPD